MRDLTIFGTGGFAREVLQVVLDLNDDQPAWNVLGFLDDDRSQHGQELHDLPILGGADWLQGRGSVWSSVAVGSAVSKRRVIKHLERLGVRSFATLVHPSAWSGRGVEIGDGAIVCAGNLLTTDLTIEEHVIVNLDCTVGHDSRIERYATVYPGVHVSGDVVVGEGTELGTGTSIIQGARIGRWSIIGAGSVVVKDIPSNVTAVGAPASVIKERQEGWHDD